MDFDKEGEKIILESFERISLDEMNEVALMNRTDTKFVLARSTFQEVLPQLKEHYKTLEVEGTPLNKYKTQYFDTGTFKFYQDHHNERSLRFKVRIRKYVESDIYFLEVKKKFKGRTNKKRIKIGDFEEVLSKDSVDYIENLTGSPIQLESKLYNFFERITLVNKFEKERLTIDLNLGFQSSEANIEFPHIVIAELKQEKVNRNSLFYTLMKQYGVRPNGFSKYCMGAMSLNPQLKSNNFKRKKLLINKLK